MAYRVVAIASIVGALFLVHKSTYGNNDRTSYYARLNNTPKQQFGHGLDEFWLGYFPGASPDHVSEEMRTMQQQYRTLGTHISMYNADESSGHLGYITPGPEQL